jgi:O-antigen/teichoic acid export membrane protein
MPMSLLPALSHMVGTDEREKIVRIISILFQTTLMVSILGAGGTLLFNKDFVRLWTGSQYYGGDSLNFLLSLSAIVQLLNTAAFNVNFATGHIKTIAKASLTEGFLHISLIALLGFFGGLPGVGAGMLLAALASLTIQGKSVLQFVDLNRGEFQWIWGALRIIFLGIIPIILEFFIMKIWTPRLWSSLAFLGLSYLFLGGVIFIVFDKNTRVTLRDILPRAPRWLLVHKILALD